MEFREFSNKYILRLDKGEEIVSTLKQFCIENGIKLGKVSGIGAVDQAEIGLFNTKKMEFQSTKVKGDHEVTGLNGNISTMNGEVYLHLHITLADEEYNSKGGHLKSAVISGTGELVLEKIDGHVDREFSEEIGLNLYKF